MAKISDLIKIMQALAPEQNTYPDLNDNVGFLVGDRHADLSTVLCCLDASSKVIEQAIELKAQLIISHHPAIFSAIKNITTDTVLGLNLIKLIKNGISVYSAHTNLDFSAGGINEYVALLLGLKNLRPLQGYISQTEGYGRIGNLDQKIKASQLLAKVKKGYGDPHAKLIGADTSVKSVAILNGGGGADASAIDLAISCGADCLITGDLKHRVCLYAAEKGFALIEANHFAVEHSFIPHLAQILKQECAQKGLNINIYTASESNPALI